jgi:Tol biopolymer transport system component/DNA-binding winged helix-turn-helix (wHTH) protein
MNRPAARHYEFGAFRVDTANRRLFRGREEVPVSPKVFETLLFLLEKPGELVGKDELIERLWPGTFVGEDTLAQKISLLRKALDDGNGSPGYISTIPKLGYRFTAEVRLRDPETSWKSAATAPDLRLPSPPYATPVAGNRNRTAIASLALVVFVCGLLVAWLAVRRPPSASAANFQIRKLDVSNSLTFGVISPDGKYLAYAGIDPGKESLWVRPVASAGKGLQVVPPTAGAFWGITYSPDEAYLYYVFAGPPSGEGILYRVNSLGGTPQRLIEDIDGAVAFEPGGRRMVYKRFTDSVQRDVVELVVARDDGTDPRPIARSSVGYPFCSYNWTPQGTIVYSEGIRKPGAIDWYISEGSADGGRETQIIGPHPTVIRTVQELNRSEIGTLANDPQSGLAQLWLFHRNGEIRRVTNDTSEYKNLSVAPRAGRMLATREETEDTIWIVDASRLTEKAILMPAAQQLPLPQGVYNHPVWTPDGNIVYLAASGGGTNEMWWIRPDGTGQRRLTSNGADSHDEEVSPDGKFVVYTVDRNGSKNIWRIDIDGSNARKLSEGGADGFPQISPDSKWVVYNATTAGKWSVWKVPSSGGTAVKIAESILSGPCISPDGKQIAIEHENPTSHKLRWGVFNFEDGSFLSDIEIPGNPTRVSWSRDGKSLINFEKQPKSQALWSWPITGEPPRMIVDLGPSDVAHYDWSRDGKQILLVRRNLKVDLVLIDQVN